MNADIISYYKDRASEYEKIYQKPERQEELALAEQFLQSEFSGAEILEIACGTGFWTERIAVTDRKILATDINDPVIEIAKTKNYPLANVDFQILDIFNFSSAIQHENLFGGFIWSHIKLGELNNFIDSIHSAVEPGGTVVFMDNNYVAGSSVPITQEDEFGNTYQTRTLKNGTLHKVLKNFPTEIFIRQLLAGKASDIAFVNLKHYWILKYKTL